ncbi:hypothetical protein GNI_116400 [Gregarina niphandrodes]|uniref:Uncharacterized protein n=1 Tax=Gregarina niphandrodes TaxID=110365 RepID=A0A023B2W8_GRENI|nr:hypothetical protein GNI_116400 [Gregarina niphandrodes]EZG55200.1 hypothetical protein GNI_116400 [Gregarina niphandrodes]|eukprot:XP_011131727.1 hypothetical protein GNI_116400 [Gregarina niphandrodes]
MGGATLPPVLGPVLGPVLRPVLGPVLGPAMGATGSGATGSGAVMGSGGNAGLVFEDPSPVPRPAPSLSASSKPPSEFSGRGVSERYRSPSVGPSVLHVRYQVGSGGTLSGPSELRDRNNHRDPNRQAPHGIQPVGAAADIGLGAVDNVRATTRVFDPPPEERKTKVKYSWQECVKLDYWKQVVCCNGPAANSSD